MSRDPLTYFTALQRAHGDMVHTTMGAMHHYLISDPELIRQLLVALPKSTVKDRGTRTVKLLLGEGLLTNEGEPHKRQRRLSQPAFHHARIAGYGEAMVRRTLLARDRLQGGARLDLNGFFSELTLGIAGETLFGADVEPEARVVHEALEAGMGIFTLARIPFHGILDRLPIPSTVRFHRGRDALDAMLYRLIAERRREGRDRGDLLSMLLLAQDDEAGGGSMSDQQLRDEVVTLLLAGHETTANALSWTFYLLSQNPAAEARLHGEIDAVLGGRAATSEDFRKLPYAERVFAEAMRLFPPAWIISREVTDPLELGGYHIPPGSGVTACQWVVHRDPRLWPDPLRFDPDRFLPEAKAVRHKFAYFPFGGGPRTCIGEGFAWMEGVLVLATLAQRFRFRLAPGHPVVPLPRVTLRLQHGLQVYAEERPLLQRPAA